MNPSPLTSHARARMQQRGIASDALDMLLSYGREAHDHHGLLYSWTRKPRPRLCGVEVVRYRARR